MSKLQMIQESEIENPLFESSLKENSQKSQNLSLKAKFERLWLTKPTELDSQRNCMEQERVKRTWQLLTSHCLISNKKVADIGCGNGYFSLLLQKNQAQVDAIDISENALRILKKDPLAEMINTFCEYMPRTKRPDENYNVIICLDLIAELPTNEYRLFFAELSRLIRPDGLLICSSGIDIDTVDGLGKLLALAKTEFEILEIKKSYHSFYIRLKKILKNPFFNFFYKKLNQSQKALLILEKISYFFYEENAVSHCIFLAKRKKIYEGE